MYRRNYAKINPFSLWEAKTLGAVTEIAHKKTSKWRVALTIAECVIVFGIGGAVVFHAFFILPRMG